MKTTYRYYASVYGGKLCQVEFEELVGAATDLVKQYAEQYIAPWALRSNLEYYCIDVNKAICYQIDYLSSNGGVSVLGGTSELDLTSVSKDGFTYNFVNNEGGRGTKFNGMPFSPLAENQIKNELRKSGLMCRRAKKYD